MRQRKRDSALRQYLQDISAYPVLSRDEETELVREIGGKGDAQAREQLVLCSLRLVVSVAKQYARGLDLMDLIEEGNLGLLHAARKFDPGRGVRFATYATWWIRKAVLRAARSSARAVRIPGYMVAMVARAKELQSRLRDQCGREPTMDEIAEKLDLTEVQAMLLRKGLAAETTSMDENLYPDSGRPISLAAMLQDKDVAPADEVVFGRMQLQTLQNLLDTIDEREAEILSLRFGLDRGGPKTLREIAARVGLSRERVRQIEKRALEKLKDAMSRAGFG